MSTREPRRSSVARILRSSLSPSAAIAALAGALKSVIYLVDPGKIVLYGRLFENSYYLLRLLSEMREGVDARHAVAVEKSRYNRRLEDKAAALLAVQRFIDEGGQRADLPA